MNKMTEVKPTQLMPTPEIVAQKLSLKKQMKEMKVETHEDECRLSALSEADYALNEKYNFFDQVFEENGLKGLKDMTGKVLVPARYQDFCECYHYDIMRNFPVAAVNAENKVGLVQTDGTGTPLTEFIYDHIHNVAWSHLYAAQIGKKVAILSPDGDTIVPCIIDEYTETINGISTFESDGKEGLFSNGGLYVAPEFDEISEKDELVYARKGDLWGYIDNEGRFIDEHDEEGLDNACCLSWID